MTKVDSGLLNSLRWRCVGPPRGGRVVAVAGHPKETAVFYFGACAGGVWKTDDGGQYWHNISDGYFKTAAVGDIAVSEADPNVIYVGTGEHTIRLDVSHGDGVYKSTDGGQSWTNVGLRATRHIAKIRIHPQNADLVYVAALGHAFGPNEERGVFRSRDGGKSWEKVLYVDEKTGAVDLTLDPNNPRILYAATYQMVRHFWTLESGGPGSAIYKSVDGGDTWTKISDNAGLPTGVKGRIGVVVSPAQSGRVWAIMDALPDGGLFRSDDGGGTWQLMTDNRDLRARPWYYCHVFADPQDANTVYVLNLRMWKSVDGGKNFVEVSTPHGDNHGLWIDPKDPQRMIEGNDGGACVSFNGGKSWSTIYNQLTAQFYHVAADSQFPYRLYGTQQDNSSISVPSRTGSGAIPFGDCYAAGTGESGHIAVHPQNPNIVYVGAVGSSPGGGGPLQRYDHNTKQIKLVTVWPEAYRGWGAEAWKYRFQWTFPIAFSPHDAGVLYTCGNLVFRSRDEGMSWQAISPDLTRADGPKLVASGGPVTKDTTGAENYGTIFAFAESPVQAGVLWVGSDDGLVHLSRDGGGSWLKVTPPDLPEWTLISMIEPSPHEAGTAYVAATRYKLDDNRPFLYKTNDYGTTWQLIVQGIPDDDFTRVMREDPRRRGLLYAGTETAVYVSFDDGANWQSLQNNLPVCPIYDLLVKENDLVAATHGRSFWILDDVTQLHQMDEQLAEQPVALLRPRDTHRLPNPLFTRVFDSSVADNKQYMITLGAAATYYVKQNEHGEREYSFLDAGQDPPQGVLIYYFLKEKPEEEVTLTLLDSAGTSLRKFSSVKPEKEEKVQTVPVAAGMNRFVWDMQLPEATKIKGDTTVGVAGPMVPPGGYQVQLKVGEFVQTAEFNLLQDPRVTATVADQQAKYELLRQVWQKQSATHEAINQLRDVREQVEQWLKRVEDEAVQAKGQALKEGLTAVEEALFQTKSKGRADYLNFPAMLANKLAEVPGVMASSDSAPTRQTYEVFTHLAAQIDEQVGNLQEILATDVSAFNALVQKAGVQAVVIS